jgi:predicted MFS family arabinose efflux permease
MTTAAASSSPSPAGNSRQILIAIGLSIGAAVSLGFSRFAYALLLPPMRQSLHWTYVQAGGMNTANAAGYIFGAVAAAWLSKRMGIKATFLSTLFVSALALLGSGLVDSYSHLSILRFIGGFSTAILFIIGASLATGISPNGPPQRTGLLVALYITGVGSGIVISGLVVPPILMLLGTAGWQSGWIWMGVISLLSLIPAILAVRAVPMQSGRESGALPWRETVFLWPTILSYALYGAGYVSYMTFIIVLLNKNGGGLGTTEAFWIVLGTASFIGTLVWGKVLAKVQGGKGLAIVSVVLLIGAMPVLIWPTLSAAFISALIFGGSFMAGPSAVTVFVRKLMPAQYGTAAIAVTIVAFAVGQAIGPVLSGYVSDATGSIDAGLWIAPILLIIAAVVAPMQRLRASAPAARPAA